MKDRIIEHVNSATTLDEVRSAVLKALSEIKTETGVSRIGYVSGVITSDGPEHMARNIAILDNHTTTLRASQPFPVFSPTDVFNDEVYERINGLTIPQQNWWGFWEAILRSGHVTDIFMTPRWEVSTGARDEHRVAKEQGLNIIFV